ncbi:MAG TPA: hypothetical protein ENK23_04810 [Sorangium sp.]|nr:hypothetical protein [Sorangium sp.]
MKHTLALFCIAVTLFACSKEKVPLIRTTNEAPRRQEKITQADIDELDADAALSFDEEAAQVVLKRGARKAQNCPKTAKAPEGEGEILAVFDGPKGRIVDVELPYLWMDAPDIAQACIKKAFIGEIIPPFEGTKKVPFELKVGGGDSK